MVGRIITAGGPCPNETREMAESASPEWRAPRPMPEAYGTPSICSGLSQQNITVRAELRSSGESRLTILLAATSIAGRERAGAIQVWPHERR